MGPILKGPRCQQLSRKTPWVFTCCLITFTHLKNGLAPDYLPFSVIFVVANARGFACRVRPQNTSKKTRVDQLIKKTAIGLFWLFLLPFQISITSTCIGSRVIGWMHCRQNWTRVSPKHQTIVIFHNVPSTCWTMQVAYKRSNKIRPSDRMHVAFDRPAYPNTPFFFPKQVWRNTRKRTSPAILSSHVNTKTRARYTHVVGANFGLVFGSVRGQVPERAEHGDQRAFAFHGSDAFHQHPHRAARPEQVARLGVRLPGQVAQYASHRLERKNRRMRLLAPRQPVVPECCGVPVDLVAWRIAFTQVKLSNWPGVAVGVDLGHRGTKWILRYLRTRKLRRLFFYRRTVFCFAANKLY